MSAADEYLTPEVIADAFEELGGVDLDPCANWYSRVNARKYVMTESNFRTPRPDWSIVDPKLVVVVPDGSWDYHWSGQGLAFCNGPYSTPHAWTQKAHTAQEAVLLVPVMTSERWWHQDLVGPNPANAILFWEGRLQFLEYDPVKDRVKRAGSARFSSALAYWGPRPGAFADVFIGCGWCVAPRHVDVARL